MPIDSQDFGEIGRSERIRTSDPLLPKQVRYQTALHSVLGSGRLIDMLFGLGKHCSAGYTGPICWGVAKR